MPMKACRPYYMGRSDYKVKELDCAIIGGKYFDPMLVAIAPRASTNVFISKKGSYARICTGIMEGREFRANRRYFKDVPADFNNGPKKPKVPSDWSESEEEPYDDDDFQNAETPKIKLYLEESAKLDAEHAPQTWSPEGNEKKNIGVLQKRINDLETENQELTTKLREKEETIRVLTAKLGEKETGDGLLDELTMSTKFKTIQSCIVDLQEKHQLLETVVLSVKRKVEAPKNKSRKLCPHGKQKWRCTECEGAGICMHQKLKQRCKQCDPNGVCHHGRTRKECEMCKARTDDLSSQSSSLSSQTSRFSH